MIRQINKKSQIETFVLFGIILVIVVGFIYYLRSNKSSVEIEEVNRVSLDIEPVKLYIDNCISSIGKSALIHIGQKGGYYELRKPYLLDENFSLPYYVVQNLDFSPSLKDIETEISKYVDNNLPSCINNFEEFNQQGFDITQGKIKSTTKIGLNYVSVNVNFPVVIKKDDKTTNLNNFKITINLELFKIYNITKEIVNEQIQNPNSICLSCLYDLAEANNFSVDAIQYQDSTLVFEIRDYKVIEDNILKNPYNFTFAVRLLNISCENFAGIDDSFFIEQCIEEQIISATQEIKLEEVPNFNVKVSEEFKYKIKASGRNLQFSDFSELFDISNNGIIQFTPTLEQIGNHSIWINLKDAFGQERFVNFNIGIVE